MASAPEHQPSRGLPRARQRAHKSPPPLDVPNISEDAAERKRVLNVLAQRRYREKKRQKRLNPGGATSSETQSRTDHSSSSECSRSPLTKTQSSHTAASEEAPTEVSPIQAATQSSEHTAIPDSVTDGFQGCLSSFAGNSLSSSLYVDAGCDFLLDGLPFVDILQSSSDGAATMSLATKMSDTELDFFASPMESLSVSHQNSTVPPMTSYSDGPSTWSPEGEFMDSYHLPVHELTLIKAMMRVADRLGCGEGIWSLDTLSPFNTSTSTPPSQLPHSWQPTTCQIEIPHHPIVDLLPWPQVRNRLLGILTLPDAARPPGTAGSMVFVNLAYDLEDNAEGVRIYNGDPYDPESWEVGQVMFERWWFLFDREIIERSNRWRASRGAPPLRLR